MTGEERVTKFENILDGHSKLLGEFLDILRKFEDGQKDYLELTAYYGSPDYFSDLEDYEKGKFSKDIKCGILSQDSIYDLIGDNFNTAIKMLEIATKIIKNH